MKIRAGFVSNSSSSSFCIYGAYFADLQELAQKLEIELKEEDLDDTYEIREKVAKKTGLEYFGGSEYDSCIYLGASWTDIRDDETGKQFKDRIKEKLEKALNKEIQCSTHEEAWYEG